LHAAIDRERLEHDASELGAGGDASAFAIR
jgi:hypothetical protein